MSAGRWRGEWWGRGPVAAGLLAVGVAWAACAGALFHVALDYTSEAVVPRGTIVEGLLGDLGFEDLVSLDVTASEELANQGVESGDIESVRLTGLVLRVTDPAGGDLSFLDEVSFWVEAPGEARVRVAWADDFPEGEAEVEFHLDDVDIAPYAVTRSMTVGSDVDGHRPEQDVTVEARVDLDVGVTAQGACRAVES